MTGHQKFKRYALVFMIVSAVFILFPFLNWDYFETLPIILLTLKWASIPLFILTLVLSFFIYKRLLAPWDPPLQSKIKQRLRPFFSVVMLSIAWTMVLMGLFFSSTVISNNYFLQTHLLVKAPVKSYDLEITRNGRKIHHIVFYDRTLNRDVYLTVNRPYEVNETFEKEMNVGHWGYLFSDK